MFPTYVEIVIYLCSKLWSWANTYAQDCLNSKQLRFHGVRPTVNILHEWFRVKNILCVSCAAWNVFPLNLLISSGWPEYQIDSFFATATLIFKYCESKLWIFSIRGHAITIGLKTLSMLGDRFLTSKLEKIKSRKLWPYISFLGLYGLGDQIPSIAWLFMSKR